MVVKKSLVTKIIWCLFVILTFGMLLVTSNGIADRLGKSGDVLFIGMSYFVILIFSEALYGISLLVKKANFSEARINGDSEKFIEIAFVIFVAVLMFMVRFIYLVTKENSILGELTYYNLAISKDFAAADAISPLAHSYVRFLDYLFTSYGASTEVCMYIQAVFHLITFLCIYFATKYMINKTAAVVSSLLFSFLVYDITDVSHINPEAMFCAVCSVSLLLLIYSLYLSFNRKLSIKNFTLYFVIAGIFSGFTAYLDYAGIALIIAGIFAIIFYNRKNSSKKRYSITWQIVIYLISSIISFVLCYVVRGVLENKIFYNILVNDYSFKNYIFKINLFVDSPAYGTLFSALIVGFSFLWLFRIWAIERDFASPVVLLTFLIVALSFFSLARDGYNNLITLLYCILAGIGFTSLGHNKVDENALAAIVDSDEKLQKSSNETNNDSSKDINASGSLEDNKEKTQENKELDNKQKSNLKKEQKKELKKKEKEAKMLEKLKKKKNTTSGINTTLTSNDNFLSEAEANLDFLKEKRAAETKTETKEVAKLEPTSVTPANNIENKTNDNLENVVSNNNVIATNVLEPENKSFVPVNSSNAISNEVAKTVEPKVENVDKVETAAEVENAVNTVNTTINLPDNNINNASNMGNVVNTNNAENLNATTQVVSAEPEKKDNVPVRKYGRRMDYKTAIVKSNNNPDLNLNAVDATALEQAKQPNNNIGNTVIENKNVQNVNAQNIIPVNNTDVQNNNPIQPMNNNVEVDKNISNIAGNSIDSKKSDIPKEIKYIKNPLPTPKKHVSKEFEFDVVPADSDMHFDIVDLKGRDFFDIN